MNRYHDIYPGYEEEDAPRPTELNEEVLKALLDGKGHWYSIPSDGLRRYALEVNTQIEDDSSNSWAIKVIV